MDELNEQFLFQMTPEQREKYRQELEMALAQTAMFLSQVNKVIEIVEKRS